MREYHIRELISKQRISARVKEIGHQITQDYQDQEILVVGVLKGSFMFFADLVRHIHSPVITDFVTLSSYGSGMESSGKVQLVENIRSDLQGKHVILVEDIIDSGNTLSFLLKEIQSKDPASIAVCSLLNKPSRRVVDLSLNSEYIGFNIPDTFVVGYGLDYDQKHRELDYVGEIIFE